MAGFDESELQCESQLKQLKSMAFREIRMPLIPFGTSNLDGIREFHAKQFASDVQSLAASHRPRVYVSGPMSQGDRIEHLCDALNAMRQLIRLGVAPLCPQLSFLVSGLLPNVEWREWMEIDLAWVRVADAVLRLPGESRGADIECEVARLKGLPVFTQTTDVAKWAVDQARKAVA